MIFHVLNPVCEQVNKINIFKRRTSCDVKGTINFECTSISIMTSYDQVKNDEMLAFIGSINTQKLTDDDYILWAMIVQQDKKSSTIPMNIQDGYKLWKLTKNNIKKSNSSYHHKSV